MDIIAFILVAVFLTCFVSVCFYYFAIYSNKLLFQPLEMKIEVAKQKVYKVIFQHVFPKIKTSQNEKLLTENRYGEYPDLGPITGIVDIEEYEELLTELLINRKDKITQIAVTSNYSGGKSSFLKTYINKHNEHNYVEINLGNYVDEEIKLNRNNNQGGGAQPQFCQHENHINQIEKSIVQQLLYRLKDEDVQKSRFRKIVTRKPKFQKLITYSISFALLVISIATIFYPDYYAVNVIQKVISHELFSYLKFFSSLYILFFAILILKDGVSFLHKYQITKFSISEKGATLETSSHDSIFNIHLEEIIHFFAVSKVNVVVFEDLDRLEKPDIFIKLKELNYLLNNSADIDQKPIVFIYAIKDDIFKDRTRVKFFDAVIPIIPVASKTNAYPQFKAELDKAGLNGEISDLFLRNVGIYLDDMRLIKSIVSEYGVYRNNIKTLKPTDYQKLLAMMVYKNIDSEDFARLQKGEGTLITLFNKKNELIQKTLTNIESQITKLEEDLTEIDNESINEIEELNALYLVLFTEKMEKEHNQKAIRLINNFPVYHYRKDSEFQALYGDNIAFRFYSQNSNNGQLNITFSAVIEGITPKYSSRRDKILAKQDGRRLELQKKIKELKDEIHIKSNWSMSQLIASLQSDDAFFELLKARPLLRQLIINNYIDEMYHLYIYHFHEGDITQAELEYIKSAKANIETKPDLKLPNVQYVFPYFTEGDFRNSSIYNFDLINYLLTTVTRNNPVIAKEYLRNLIRGITKSKKYLRTRYQILIEPIINGDIKNGNEWFKSIVMIDKRIVSVYIHRSEKTTSVLKLLSIIEDQNLIKHLAEDSELIEKLNKKSDLSSIEFDYRVSIENFLAASKVLNLSFQEIDFLGTEPRLIDEIIKNNLYALTPENLLGVISYLEKIPGGLTKITPEVINKYSEELNSYITNEKEAFFNNIICSDKFHAEDSYYKSIVFDGGWGSSEGKIKLIKNKGIYIEKLNDENNVDITVIEYIVNSKKIKPSWGNVNKLILNYEVPVKELVYYLNERTILDELLLSEKEKLNQEDLNKVHEIFIEIWTDEGCDESVIIKMLPYFDESIVDDILVGFNDDKLKFAIEKKLIPVDDYYLIKIKDNNPEFFNLYLKTNINEIMEKKLFDDEAAKLTNQELMRIIQSGKFSIGQLNYLIPEHDYKNESVSDVLVAELLRLVRSHPKLVLTEDMFRALINEIDLSTEIKIQLMTHNVDYIKTVDELNRILETLPPPYKDLAKITTHKWINYSSINESFAETLRDQGLFKSVHVHKEKGHIMIYVLGH